MDKFYERRIFMKEQILLQVNGNDISIDSLPKSVKQWWKAEGKIVKDIQKLDLYVKPEENKCYFVINDETKGSIDLI